MFSYDMWNMHEGIKEDDPILTNNGLEAFNRTWNQEMGIRPNMWKVIKGFVKMESETKRILVSNAAGQDMNSNIGRKSLVKNQYERIAKIVNQCTLNLLAHELSLH